LLHVFQLRGEKMLGSILCKWNSAQSKKDFEDEGYEKLEEGIENVGIGVVEALYGIF
jgi:hypothetical protein